MKPYARISPWQKLPPKGWRVPVGVYSTMWFYAPGLKPIRVGG